MEYPKKYRPYNYKRICRNPEHAQEFETNSPTRLDCCDSCKNRYHYLKNKTLYANDLFFDKKHHTNYLLIKDLFVREMNPVTPRDLIIQGVDLHFAPYVGKVGNKIAVYFNDLALVNENNLIRILKIGPWKSNH